MAAAQNMAMTSTQKIIAIAVTIIIISTVAIPIIDDLQDQQTTVVQNTTEKYVSSANTDGAVTLSFVGTSFYVNGVETDKPTWAVLAASPKMILASSGATATTMQLITKDLRVVITSLTWNNGNVSYVAGDSTEGTVSDVGDIFYVAKKGDYGLFYGTTDDYHINVDQKALVVAHKGWASTSPAFDGVFELKNGEFTASDFTLEANTLTYGEPFADVTTWSFGGSIVKDGDSPNYVVSPLSLTYVNPSNSTSYTDVGVYVFAPLAYNIISSEDASMINLIGIIPIILILVPLMMAVRMMALKRN